MSKFSAKTAYCLGESGNEYDQGLIAFFTKVFEAAGGKVITDSFPTGNSDFGSYLNKAKSEGADVIFTPVSIAYAVQIITQAASLGIEAPFLGSDTLDDNMVLEAIKGMDANWCPAGVRERLAGNQFHQCRSDIEQGHDAGPPR